jgi:hypothetical protein
MGFYPIRNNAPLEFLTGFTHQTHEDLRDSPIPNYRCLITDAWHQFPFLSYWHFLEIPFHNLTPDE